MIFAGNDRVTVTMRDSYFSAVQRRLDFGLFPATPVSMPPLTPPNPALAEMISVLGEADTQDIVRTFLSDAPSLLEGLAPPALLQSFSAAERAKRHRAAHSLKSSARLVGADAVADRAAIFERRLSLPDGKVTSEDVAALAADLAAITPVLQKFVGQ